MLSLCNIFKSVQTVPSFFLDLRKQKLIKDHIIQVTEKSFDDFADSGSDEEGIKKILEL